MDIKIDKGIKPRGRRAVYPFSDMEPGDSFLAPLDKAGSVRVLASVHSDAGKLFQTESGPDGVRVFRIR